MICPKNERLKAYSIFYFGPRLRYNSRNLSPKYFLSWNKLSWLRPILKPCLTCSLLLQEYRTRSWPHRWFPKHRKRRFTDACSMIHKLSNADCACKTLRSYRCMFDVRRFLAHSLQFFVICSVHSIQNVEPLAEEKVNCTKMHRKEKVILGLWRQI